MTDISSIDDLLSTGKTNTQPEAPEHQPEIENGTDYEDNNEVPEQSKDEPESLRDSATNIEPEDKPAVEHDEYGNAQEKSRTYTEEEHRELVNKAVRERLARAQRNDTQPNAQQMQQVQHQAQGFNYDPDSNQDWQQQLEGFVEQTFNKINQKQVTQAQQQREAQAESEFRDKFTQGMDKFSDFREVVSAQPVTDAMTLALRGINDPAAFIYAASKRNPQELERIAKISDPYSQMVEMGKLEERMRKSKQTTNAPRPLSRTNEDATMKERPKSDKEPSIEQQIAASEARKMAQLKARRR